jgi:SAM-dependent methyltransferase
MLGRLTEHDWVAPLEDRNLQYIDFGCGNGHSTQFVTSLVQGRGLGIDVSEQAVEACLARNLEAEVGDLLEFNLRSVATATFAIDIIPELPGRQAFERALVNMVRAARNFAFVQHSYFDADPSLALEGLQIEANHHKRVQYKPTVADYIAFARRHRDPLQISGLGIFAIGQAVPTPLTLDTALPPPVPVGDEAAAMPRSLRVILGRRDAGRFRAALEKGGSGKVVFIWERN